MLSYTLLDSTFNKLEQFSMLGVRSRSRHCFRILGSALGMLLTLSWQVKSCEGTQKNALANWLNAIMEGLIKTT